jgi:serine-type D-Ala-D-Ala carboxypeptidase (penicillin-binding protein 5/6)
MIVLGWLSSSGPRMLPEGHCAVAACAVIGGRTKLTRRSSPAYLHFKTRSNRRFPFRAVVVVLVVLIVLAGAGAIRAFTESTPGLTVKRVLPASVVLDGRRPAPAWPAVGEAAVEVEGLPPLGSSGPDRPLPIASVAKIMTAYVVLRDHPFSADQGGFAVTVSAADVADFQARLAQQQSVVAVREGEILSELQLLEGLLVGSGNNIGTILAEHDAGSVPAFVARMNATARQLGLSHTTYTDPSGLASTTVSTAADQLLLAAQAMAVPAFARVVAMRTVDLPVAGTLVNFNRAVGTDGYVGIKTGSDATAGGCLVFANNEKVSGRTITILGVVLGQDAGQRLTTDLTTAALKAANALVHSVIAAVAVRTLVPAGTVVAVVANGSGAKVNAATIQPLTTVGFGGLTVPIAVTISRLGDQLSAGETVASVRSAVAENGATAATATSSMPGPTWRWRLSHIL